MKSPQYSNRTQNMYTDMIAWKGGRTQLRSGLVTAVRSAGDSEGGAWSVRSFHFKYGAQNG